MYTCVNAGCPDAGATVMECKAGYEGPLCAVCSEGYFLQLHTCADCGGSGPSSASVALFVVSLLVAIGLAVAVVCHRRFLASTGVFAHVKILVSFVAVMLTVDRQFGITWPAVFQKALAALSVLSLDFGILASMLCVVKISFYNNLLCTTLLLVVLMAGLYLADVTTQHRHQSTYRFIAIYLLLFAYPMVSVKVVELFGCHDVEGVYYLRVDYSIECYTSQWNAMAVYALVLLITYVAGFPIFVGATLWSYRHKLREHVQGPGQVCKLAPTGLMLGFLLDDYALKLPCYMWETEEMVRKLLLSVIASFWGTKSVMCIATALIVSLVFQLLHTHYRPFKSPACNRLQHICLSVLNIVYITGLLLKTQAVTASDERDVGILLVVLFVTAVVIVACGVVFEIRFLWRAWTRMKKLTALLKKLPQQDPPDDSQAFYDIRIPVEKSNMGDAFEPKSQSELKHKQLSDESKLAVIRQLTEVNEGLLKKFLHNISIDPMIPLQQVESPMLVTSEGRMCVECGRKTERSILQKACRPDILKKNPKFGIEHLRDTFRFRATVFSFRDIVEFILALNADSSLCGKGGLTPGNIDIDKEGNKWLVLRREDGSSSGAKAGNVAKLDIKKLVKPTKTGWRFIALDFILPNHQIVECYIRFYEMMLVADLTPAEYGETSSVCAGLNQHQIFEKWRMHDADNLQAEYARDEREMQRSQDKEKRIELSEKWDVDETKWGGYDTGDLQGEYERDLRESNRRFEKAFRLVRSHTTPLELQEFGKLFSMTDGKSFSTIDGAHDGAATHAQDDTQRAKEHDVTLGSFHNNPMCEHSDGQPGAEETEFGQVNPMFRTASA
jgi:hypothetical protein